MIYFVRFYNIQGYDDIKDIVRGALDAEDNYNLVFVGPPASAKTLFLLGILDMRKDGCILTARIPRTESWMSGQAEPLGPVIYRGRDEGLHHNL
jgi:hypothetical protein